MLGYLFGVCLLSIVASHQFDVPSYVCDSLNDPPQLNFEIELQDVTVQRGDEVTLKCSVYGAPQASISWYHKSRRVESFPTAGLELALPTKIMGVGIVESTLRICADFKTAGDYVCVATNPCGQSVTSEATVSLLKSEKKTRGCNYKKIDLLPYITLSTVNRMEYSGNPVQLQCRAAGYPKPQIQWFRVDEEEKLEELNNKNQYMALSNGDLLVIGDDNSVVSESFRCIAKNSNGQAEADSTIVFFDE